MDITKPVKCPRCEDIMKKTVVRDFENKELEFNYCLGCAGIFFDDKELERVLKAPFNIPLKVVNISHYKDLSETRPEGQRYCGRCSSLMEMKQISGLTIDLCRKCLSIFVDGGELGEILEPVEKSLVKEIYSSKIKEKPEIINNRTESKLKCPNCQFLFRKMEVAGKERVFNLDFCAGCTGIWFDKGELDTLLLDKRHIPTKLHNIARALEEDEITEQTELCPRCQIHLTSKNIYEETSIDYSVCLECGGFFLLSRELYKLCYYTKGIISEESLMTGEQLK